MTWRRCDGSDLGTVSRYGERPCSCGETFDDGQISAWWPHLPVVTKTGRRVEDAVPDLPACYRAPAGVVHGPGCACPP